MSMCYACQEEIESNLVSALERTYHPECFICTKCKEPITETKFYTHEGNPYCTKDYAASFASICRACQKPILDKFVFAMDYNWHENHFLCALCRVILTGQTFVERDGKPLCENCHQNNLVDACKVCGKEFDEKMIIALEEKWHAECFKCKTCDLAIVTDTFHVEDGSPVCINCAAILNVTQ